MALIQEREPVPESRRTPVFNPEEKKVLREATWLQVNLCRGKVAVGINDFNPAELIILKALDSIFRAATSNIILDHLKPREGIIIAADCTLDVINGRSLYDLVQKINIIR